MPCRKTNLERMVETRKKYVTYGLIFFVVIAILWAVLPYQGVPALTYHHIGDSSHWYYVSPKHFEYQMLFLKLLGYSPISLQEMMTGLAGQSTLPWKPILITFDDGYQDNWLQAVPVLEKYGFRAAFFVVTGKMGARGYVSWQELEAMQKKGMEIGSHTVNHYPPSVINLKEFSRELMLSRVMLQNNLQPPVNVFANPHGETTPEIIALLKQTGYVAACSSIAGSNFADTDRYLIRRVTIKNMSGAKGAASFLVRMLWLDVYNKLPFLAGILEQVWGQAADATPQIN